MTSRIFKLSALLAAFAFVASASACPKDSKCGKKKNATTLAAFNVAVDGRTEIKDTTTTKTTTAPCSKSGNKGGCGSKKGCGGTGCDKPDCCKNKAAMAALKSLTETTTSKAKAGCTKPCCKNKNAATVAAASTPCCDVCASCPDCKAKNFVNCADCPKCKAKCDGKGCDKKDCCKKKGAATAAVAAAVTETPSSGCKKPCGGGCKKNGAAAVTAALTPSTDSKKPCGADCTKDCCKKGATVASKDNTPCGKKCGTKKTSAFVGADGVKRCPLTGKPIKDDDCPIGKKVDAVLTSLPTMKYKIGDEVTCCSKSAAAMAKNTNTKMKYLVGDDVFETQNEASAKLVAAYEMEVNNLNSMQFAVGNDSYRCPMTAKEKAKEEGKKMAYRVAGFDFPEQSKAEDTLKQIAETVADVKMSYKVGDQKFCCDKMAGAKVKETGSTMSYIVGDEETTDEFAAKMNLAEAKIRAIVRTAAAAMGS